MCVCTAEDRLLKASMAEKLHDMALQELPAAI